MGADVTRRAARRRSCRPASIALGVRVTTSIDDALEGADVVMMLRVQHERMHGLFLPSVREYFTLFGLTPARLERAAPDAIVMHPGPMNRGVEIDSEVADGPWSVILDQVANGVAVRMAVLYLLAGGDGGMSRDELLLKTGHVVDPVAGRNGRFDILIDGDRIARIGRDLPADGARVVEVPASLRRHARAHRHARAPARAGPGAQGDDRDRHGVGRRRRIHRRRVHAEHRSDQRPGVGHASSS